MEIKNIFFVTPIGEKGSDARNCADLIFNDVLLPLEPPEKFGCKFWRADIDGSGSDLSRSIFTLTRDADLIVADVTDSNPNVLYEIGLAHALGKPVVYIMLKGSKKPSDIPGIYYFPYTSKLFDSKTNTPAIRELENDLIKQFNKIRKIKEFDNSYVPYTDLNHLTTEKSLQDIKSLVEQIFEKQNENTGTGNNTKITATFITGENAAFDELTNAVNGAKESIRTTRFSPHTVLNRQKEFFTTIRNIMTTAKPPKIFKRIIAANASEKLAEITELIGANNGRAFEIYITSESYGFEIVIIDEVTVFIHFREGKDSKSTNLISATLKFSHPLIAQKFVLIFDSIAESPGVKMIDCMEINNTNHTREIKKISNEFVSRLPQQNSNVIGGVRRKSDLQKRTKGTGDTKATAGRKSAGGVSLPKRTKGTSDAKARR